MPLTLEIQKAWGLMEGSDEEEDDDDDDLKDFVASLEAAGDQGQGEDDERDEADAQDVKKD